MLANSTEIVEIWICKAFGVCIWMNFKFREREERTGDDDEEESFEKDDAALPSFVFLIIYLLVLLSATC